MSEVMRVLDLFSGIGGFSLGLERAGMETVAFCESEPYCQRVLRKHWPGVPIHDDIKTLSYAAGILKGQGGKQPSGLDGARHSGSRDVRETVGAIDVVCGGFPCQPVSVAGSQKGDADERWLWPELARVLGEVRPRYALLENVSALLSIDGGRLFGGILADLAALGFDVEWHCISAAHVGAPHIRDRVWIVAFNPDANDSAGSAERRSEHERPEEFAGVREAHASNSDERRREGERQPGLFDRYRASLRADLDRCAGAVSDAERDELRHEPGRRNGSNGAGEAEPGDDGAQWDVADANGPRLEKRNGSGPRLAQSAAVVSDWWSTESGVCGVAHGIPNRAHRLRALGNAVVPQVVEVIGRAIMATERAA